MKKLLSIILVLVTSYNDPFCLLFIRTSYQYHSALLRSFLWTQILFCIVGYMCIQCTAQILLRHIVIDSIRPIRGDRVPVAWHPLDRHPILKCTSHSSRSIPPDPVWWHSLIHLRLHIRQIDFVWPNVVWPNIVQPVKRGSTKALQNFIESVAITMYRMYGLFLPLHDEASERENRFRELPLFH